MCEILFRGKNKKGEWFEGFYCPCCFGYFPCRSAIVPKKDMDEGCWKPEKVIPETIGQYTGLTDKHGTKIFTGDIIETDNGKISAISVVKYGEFEPKMFYDLLESHVMPRPKEKMIGVFAESTNNEQILMSNCSKLIKVIGNIHDNPELLKLFGGENND